MKNIGILRMKEIIRFLEDIFVVALGSFQKTYTEIKNRTKERTKFK
ncbi:RteC domain-containing protein [Polaribacter sp. Asnod6-C07]